MKTIRPFTPDRRRTAASLTALARGAVSGFVLGLLLSLLAGSWLWLEMRVNVGLLIPVMTLACLAAAVRWEDLSSPRFLVLLDLLAIAAFVVLYGFDPVALRVVPASFFRQGFQARMSLGTANAALVIILTAGNAFMFMNASPVGKEGPPPTAAPGITSIPTARISLSEAYLLFRHPCDKISLTCTACLRILFAQKASPSSANRRSKGQEAESHREGETVRTAGDSPGRRRAGQGTAVKYHETHDGNHRKGVLKCVYERYW